MTVQEQQVNEQVEQKFGVQDLPSWLGWLGSILAKAAKISDEEVAVVDNGPVGPDEQVVGTIPGDLLRLNILAQSIHADAGKMVEAHKQTCTGDRSGECGKFYTVLDVLKDEYENVTEVFWTSVRYSLNITAERIGIRENNTIVILPEESEEDQMLEMLGGRGIPAGLAQILGLGRR